MNRIKDYVKNNKLYLLIMIIGILAFFIQLIYVTYSADDYTFGTISRTQGISGIIQKSKSYYFEWRRDFMFFHLIYGMGRYNYLENY